MPDSTTNGATALSLKNCSLDELIAGLLSGTPVSRGGGGDTFALSGEDGRKIFAFYRKRRDLWPRNKQVQGSEIESILRALEEELPAFAPCAPAPVPPNRIWTLKRLEAHRYAGLHRHCGPDGQDPDPFVLELDRDIALISGFNGAGKTALLSAIVWCLTGKALRSQRMPDEVHEPMSVEWVSSSGIDGSNGAERGELSLPPVVPLPSGKDLEVLKDQPKIDSWVRLTFHAEGANETCVVTRRLEVSRNGRVSMHAEGLEGLGIPSLGIEVGTLMPGIAAQMRFDEKTVFPAAIAQLTGLKPLEDFGKRAERIVARLRGDETRKTQENRGKLYDQFGRQKQSLLDAWDAQPELGKPETLVGPGEKIDDLDCKESIASARKHLEGVQHDLEAAVDDILGHRLELAGKEDADALTKRLDEAADQFKGSALGSLPAINLAIALGGLSEEELEQAQALVENIKARAEALAERLADETKAARWQLYAKVAAWHETHHPAVEVVNCPVCGTDLNDVSDDALLDVSVKSALESCREADADAAKTAAEWERDEASAVVDRLPEGLRGFVDQQLPEKLIDLYRKGFVEELFKDKAFTGRLEPLKQGTAALWDLAAAEHPLPEPAAFDLPQLPEIVGSGTLAKRLGNIARALHLARHRQLSKSALEGLVGGYVGTAKASEAEEGEQEEKVAANRRPLREQIELIRACVQSAEPVISLKRQLDELEKTRQDWEAAQHRLDLLVRAAEAMEPFGAFPDLVYEQVTGLIGALHVGIEKWLRRLYRPHYLDGPSYGGFDPADEFGVGLRATLGEVQVAAHHVMNASLLRACVWAFMFSLWEHVRAQGSGLSCMLLDDPQTHFDPINCENLAGAIPDMSACGMRLILTSNDGRFLASVRDKLPPKLTDSPTWSAHELSPISSSRLTASANPAVEEVRERRDRWREDNNDSGKAQRFVERVRQHIEGRLWDLLATDPLVIHDPTLADLLNQLRGARRRGERPFEEPPFDRLLAHRALRDGAEFYRIINNAHHRIQNITPHDAGIVDSDFGEIDSLLRGCAAAYARFMGRLTREDSDLLLVGQPEAPPAAETGDRVIRLLGRLAARSAVDVLADSAEVEEFAVASLGPVAFYAIRGPGLGSLALRGQVVMAALEQEACDGDPVIALVGDSVYARRLARDRRDPSRLSLVADKSGADRVPPAVILPSAKTRVLPIVGILFENQSVPGRDEAVLIERSPILTRRLEAARVVEDSAYPIVRSGDIVLIERIERVDAEALRALEGRMVAVVASSGSGESMGLLKRLGTEVGTGVRVLENIGLNGRAVVVATVEDDAGRMDVPVLQRLWRVHGVLRLGDREIDAMS